MKDFVVITKIGMRPYAQTLKVTARIAQCIKSNASQMGRYTL